MAVSIPAGLRADLMRKRMQDKATMTAIGGIYMGSATQADLDPNDYSDISDTVYETTCLVPGTSGYPLVSQGAGSAVAYTPLTGTGIASGAITNNHLAGNITWDKMTGQMSASQLPSDFTAPKANTIRDSNGNYKSFELTYSNGILTIVYQ